MTESKWTAKTISDELNLVVSRVDRPGDYCTSGQTPLVLPGLQVEGLGPIGLPLTASQAQELKACCEQAPYGKGEATLVDVRVRRVWHLSPEQFSLTNPEWSATLKQIVSVVQAGLGLKDQTLDAHLYDLLLYEEGGFFLPHRDGEKLERMVATLVIVLPSPFQGGELVVRHEGQQQTIEFCSDPKSSFQIQYAAFYADCEHEVKPLKKGHRLCLIYNLTLAKRGSTTEEEKTSGSKAKSKSTKIAKSSKKTVSPTTKTLAIPITAPRIGEHITEIGRVLTAWSQAKGATVPQKLAIRLEHKYTKDGLAWDALKGADRAKATALATAAAQSGCHAFLAMLTFWESGSSESYDDYDYGSRGRYGSRRRGRSWDEDDEDDEDEVTADEDEDGDISGKYEMGEVFDESLTVERLTGYGGENFPINNFPIEPEEIVPPDSLRLVKPEEDYEGYTGNAGMTLDRWYHHAVVLIWPDQNHFDVLCSCGSREAAKALLPLVAQMRRSSKLEADTLKTQCHQFAERIIAHWPESDHPRPEYDDEHNLINEEAGIGARFLDALLVLEDCNLVSACLRKVLTRDASVDPGQSLVAACDTFGWATFQNPLEAVFALSSQAMLARNVRLLDHLATAEANKSKGTKRSQKKSDPVESNPARIELCRSLAATFAQALMTFEAKKEASYYDHYLDRTVLLTKLVRVLVSTNQDNLLSQFLSHALAVEKKFPLISAHVAALSQLADWLPSHFEHRSQAVSSWIADVTSQLAVRTISEPQVPTDFCRPAAMECKCAECKRVNKFLADPLLPEYRLRARQEIRNHVNNEIRNNTECDLTTTTDRKGSPQTLVCTKTTASFERSLKTYHEDLKHLAAVQSLATSLRD